MERTPLARHRSYLVVLRSRLLELSQINAHAQVTHYPMFNVSFSYKYKLTDFDEQIQPKCIFRTFISVEVELY